MFHIWSDGSCSGNPGPGGYAAYIKHGLSELAVCGYDSQTTNNRMELMGFISGITTAASISEKESIVIYTDSKYIENAINCKWLKKWHTKDYKDVKNDDLWRTVHRLLDGLDIAVVWVKGHSNVQENVIADKLAVEARDGVHGKYSMLYF